MLSIMRLRSISVDISGNIFTNRSYLDFIADSRQLMTSAVRNIGVNESVALANLMDSAVMLLHRVPIEITPSPPNMMKFSISAILDKSPVFFAGDIIDDLQCCAA